MCKTGKRLDKAIWGSPLKGMESHVFKQASSPMKMKHQHKTMKKNGQNEKKTT